MIAIQTVGLTKKYGKITAVDNLNISVNKGELFALLGLNGAGKTTTIKMLSCLTRPTSGDAILLGDSIISKPLSIKQKTNIHHRKQRLLRILLSVKILNSSPVFMDKIRKPLTRTLFAWQIDSNWTI